MIEVLIELLSSFIFKELAFELEQQGHVLSGNLLNSFEAKIGKQTEDKLTIDFLMLSYGLSLNDGIKPSRIPYTIGGPKRGGTSKYIEGLVRFAKARFFADEKRALQIAFAIARKQKEQGYPLTGKIGFIDNTLFANEDKISEIIEDSIEVVFNELIESFTKTQFS